MSDEVDIRREYPCWCGGVMRLRALVKAEPGHALYECVKCGHATVLSTKPEVAA